MANISQIQLPNGDTYGFTTNLTELTDTTISSPSNGQILAYDSTSSKWVNASAPSGDGEAFVTDMEWKDIYHNGWQAGYYYDPDNDYAYTQIPSTETTWGESQTYIAVSCTPYTNLIPVVSGEKWRYRNMPVHFDSKNKEVPSIIIFDSNKDVVIAYTRTYGDEYTEFTIPENGVWMAVLYANNQVYALQKQVVKTHFEDEILDMVKADYRAYSLATPPTPRTLTKGYICFGTDDLRPWATKNLHTLFTSNNIPYYMASIPEAVKACVTDDPYKTNLDYMRLCVTNGGEIISHSNDWITESNKNDFTTMYKYFCKNKEELETYGFTVRGIFKAGGENAIYGQADSVIDAWATHYYEYGDEFTNSFPYSNGRTLLDDWESYSNLNSVIQNVVENHGYVIFAFHEYNSNAELAVQTVLNALGNYTEGTDYEFATPGQVYDLLMPTTTSSGGADTNTTYTLSRSSNVITLTGSDSSTSSITLPVYNGGVQTV